MFKLKIRAALQGPMPSISTPFLANGEVDYAGLRKMVEFDIEHGAKTIMLTAGDSHYVCLSENEIEEMTKTVIDQTARRAMVITADRYYNTKQAVEFAKFARDAGSDLHMVMPPDWGASCSPETLAEHYASVAEVMPVMVVTNIFISRGIEFGMNTLRKALAMSDNIVAIKDDFCGVFSRKMAAEFFSRAAIVSGGQKMNHWDIHGYGCDGYLSTFSKFAPQIAKQYWELVRAEDLFGATRIIKEYDLPFFNLISTFQGGFDSGIHGSLELFGIAGRWRRKPYVTLNDAEMEKLKVFFQARGLLSF